MSDGHKIKTNEKKQLFKQKKREKRKQLFKQKKRENTMRKNTRQKAQTELFLARHEIKMKEPNTFTGIFGKRGMGKTVFGKYLAQNSEWAEDGIYIVIARTAKSRIFWAKTVHPAYVHPPSLELLKTIRETQEKNVEKYEKRGQPFPRCLHVTLIIDDCGSLGWFMQSNEMSELACNSRQDEMDVILILQHLTHAYADVREMFDRILVLGTNNENIVKLLQKEFVCCTKWQLLSKIITSLTNKKGKACVIDTTTPGGYVEEVCFALKIPKNFDIHNTIPIGGKAMRKAADENLMDEKEEFKKFNVDDDSSEEEKEEESEPEDPPSVFEDCYGRLTIRCLPKGQVAKPKKD